MFFNSFVFLAFLAVVLPIYYLLPSQKLRAAHLLVASYCFYGYWDWRFCGLLALSTVVDFALGRRLARTDAEPRRRQLLFLSLFVNLTILGFFKYFNFFIESIESTVRGFGGHVDFLHLNIVLPVGISFYTFQSLSYTIDIYRRRLEPTRSLINFALFVAFFPQLVAGPIERARALLPQVARLGRPSRQQVSSGLVLIAMGYLRKVLIGDTCGRIVDHVFGQDTLYRSPELLAALILFSVQIYADFSGYSRIARGLARLLGVELMRNFEQPYLAANIADFWRRWHISLSSWLKDYLYIPLGGNRHGRRRTYINLMITMLLGGLWHGASWNFVVWGGLHGVYLAVHRLTSADTDAGHKPRSSWSYLASMAVTNLLVLFAWLFFRAESFAQSTRILQNLVHWQSSELALRFAGISAAYVLMVLALDVLEYRSGSHSFLLSHGSPARAAGVCAGIAVFVLLVMATSRPMPFVYFQF